MAAGERLPGECYKDGTPRPVPKRKTQPPSTLAEKIIARVGNVLDVEGLPTLVQPKNKT